MINQLQNTRDHIDQELHRNYPNHRNWFHLIHQGISYHFYIDNIENRRIPAQIDIDVSVRIVRDEIFELEIEPEHHVTSFAIPNGQLAARVQNFEVTFELENMPSVQYIYKHWLHHGDIRPQFANVLVILE